jgi:hypothetical protein
MLENLDPVLLARIQFAFTISFHILFPGFHHRAGQLAGGVGMALAEDGQPGLC